MTKWSHHIHVKTERCLDIHTEKIFLHAKRNKKTFSDAKVVMTIYTYDPNSHMLWYDMKRSHVTSESHPTLCNAKTISTCFNTLSLFIWRLTPAEKYPHLYVETSHYLWRNIQRFVTYTDSPASLNIIGPSLLMLRCTQSLLREVI